MSCHLMTQTTASGGGGNRTRVLWFLGFGFYVHSSSIDFAAEGSMNKAYRAASLLPFLAPGVAVIDPMPA